MALKQQLPKFSGQMRQQVLSSPLIVPSARVAQVATEVGFAAVHTARNATDTAVLDCLEALLVENEQHQ